MLTFAAKEIDIVDPFFDLRPLNGDYVGPLSALLAKLAAAGCEGKTFRIHYRSTRLDCELHAFEPALPS